MAWIEVHQELVKHPKVLRVAVELKVSRYEVVGRLVALWGWALDAKPDGGPLDPIDVLAGADWTAKGDLVGAFVDASLLDMEADGLWLHDWDEYAGRLVRQRKLARDRARSVRAASPQRTRTVREQFAPTVPNPTQQNRTEPDRSSNERTAENPKPRSARRAKSAPTLTDEQRERLISKYQAPAKSKQAVEDAIELSLSHKAAKNYERTDLYVDKWLRREFIDDGTTGRGAGRGASTTGDRTNGGGTRQGGVASRGAGAGEAQRTYEGPPRPTSTLPVRSVSPAAPVAGAGAS